MENSWEEMEGVRIGKGDLQFRLFVEKIENHAGLVWLILDQP
jgi:hypothetical protein